MEKTLGISNKVKKAKITRDSESSPKNKKDPKNKTNNLTTKNHQRIEQPPNTLSVIGDKVKTWIQYGKKWVGL